MAASGSRHELRYIAEVTQGTTPGTPAMKRLRNTGTTLNLTKDQLTSEEIRADRQIVDMRHGNKRVGGDINFELSYGSFDEILEAALFGAWTTNVLKAGTAMKTLTIERAFLDINQFLRYTGCGINTMSLNIVPNRMVTGTFGVVGHSMETAGTQLGAPTDAGTAPPFDSFTGVLQEGGVTNAIVTALTLNIANGIDPSFVLMKQGADELLFGRSNVTGRVSAKFNDLVQLNKFINETESSLSVQLDGPNGDLTILLTRIKYSGGDLPVTGEGPVVLDMPFQALRDATAGTNIQLTRAP
jgi:hypothetical protein